MRRKPAFMTNQEVTTSPGGKVTPVFPVIYPKLRSDQIRQPEIQKLEEFYDRLQKKTDLIFLQYYTGYCFCLHSFQNQNFHQNGSVDARINVIDLLTRFLPVDFRRLNDKTGVDVKYSLLSTLQNSTLNAKTIATLRSCSSMTGSFTRQNDTPLPHALFS